MTEKILLSSRRRFLTRTFPARAFACLGCKGLLAWPGQQNKFSENPGMTTEEMFRFFYGTFVPVLQIMARDMGREEMIKELTRASAENWSQMIASMAKDMPKRDMKAFVAMMDGMMGAPPSNRAFAYEVVESSDRVHEVKFTRCLPALMWREMKAADLGYALECSPSDALAKAFNPRMKGADLMTIMRGNPYCIIRFELV